MTKREAAIVSAHTGILIGDFDEVLKYASDLLKRPVFVHQMAGDAFWDELNEKSLQDFVEIEVHD
jgi:hypothetical protein